MIMLGRFYYSFYAIGQTVFKFVFAKASCLIYDYLFKSSLLMRSTSMFNILIYLINNIIICSM